MILKKVRAINFKKLGVNEVFEFEFPETCLLIRGKNESGKSSIVELILFCLFGQPIKSQSRSSTRRDMKLEDYLTRKKNVGKYTLQFQVQGKTYEIHRELRRRRNGSVSQDSNHTYLKDVDNNSFIAQNSIDAVKRQLLEIIKIDMHTILSSNYVAQKELNQLNNMNYQNWKTTINKILNLESFNLARDDINKKVKDDI
ncbi:MAG: AAA family ATPase, partial [Promethearchaeota archaeon]